MANHITYAIQVILFSVIAVALAVNTNTKRDRAGEFSKQLHIPLKSKVLQKFKVDEAIMVGNFKWSNCNPDAPLQIIALTLSDPISIPGVLTVGFNGTAGVDVVAGLSAKLVLKKRVAGIKVTVPCVDNVGSCTYTDVCSMIPPTPPSGCPPPLPQYKIPCACPYPKGHYLLPNLNISLPDVPLPKHLAGEYYVNVKTYNTVGTNLACYNMEFELKA